MMENKEYLNGMKRSYDERSDLKDKTKVAFKEYIFNFLSAHTRGTELRNTSFIMGISNLMGNILLVPAYGAMGAAWVSFISCAVCSITRWSYYRWYIQQREVRE